MALFYPHYNHNHNIIIRIIEVNGIIRMILFVIHFNHYGYPLVNIQKAIENGHRNSWFTHEKWWIFPSFFVNVYQRVHFFWAATS